MIYITKFRENDLNPSKGKQIEFNKMVVEEFFKFDKPESFAEFVCRSLSNPAINERIQVQFKLSPSRGDYKIYQNSDGSKDLKDFFVETLHLSANVNIGDYFAIKKVNASNYTLYYIPKGSLFSDFFPIISGDQILFVAEDTKEIIQSPSSLQQIYYGAPGTGKSYAIQQLAPKEATIRTTFHPDSDYSTFVGAYKPTMCKTGEVNAVGKEEEKISYKFIPQAFLKAYIKAWANYPEPQYLVIEEINRGNCAQIFGDLFQLLDRNEDGFSDYPIDADDDIRQYISEQGLELNGCDLPDTLKNAIINGEKLVLPCNLYIWATMNTSDQSLFPIDSAFKRRWDWVYIPIANVPDKNWKIRVGDSLYDWWTFIDKINGKIQVATESQDKKLGYFFAKADKSGVISIQNFVGKVLFYLWNDVFRDYPLEGDDLLQDGDHTLVFEDFFYEDGSVNTQKVKRLLSNLRVEPDQTDVISDDWDDEDDDDGEGRDHTKYSINGVGQYAKKNLVWEIVSKYIADNSATTAEQVLREFDQIKDMVSHGIETQSEYDARRDSYKDRVKEVNCNGETLYVSTNGWGGKETMNKLMKIVNQKPWGITVTEA